MGNLNPYVFGREKIPMFVDKEPKKVRRKIAKTWTEKENQCCVNSCKYKNLSREEAEEREKKKSKFPHTHNTHSLRRRHLIDIYLNMKSRAGARGN